ncbi:DUF5615 family PIN-like protein [Acidicapsa acidisoli]|uniref:DUF5615 family PIN-like protein n=1 Tax=Acidicapsa acidisoli TaxID=1615681 RepID=UPI0021E04BE9|nr:DUF5615 family PIN-like protein [Acidicapsa acidisoli]
MQKLLLDENLSPTLVDVAHAMGFVCSHINFLGLNCAKDWELKSTILDGDYTFVTNNSVDFRGPAKTPGSQGVYSSISLHAGLVCIDATGGLNLDRQKRLFVLILSDIEKHGDLTNQVLQVTLTPDGAVELSRYSMPR